MPKVLGGRMLFVGANLVNHWLPMRHSQKEKRSNMGSILASGLPKDVSV